MSIFRFSPTARFAVGCLILAGGLAASGGARAATYLYNFESEPIVETTPLSITSGGLTATFAGSSLGDPGAFAISFNSTSGPLPLYQTLSGAFLGSSPFTSIDPASPLTITFSAPVRSVSLNFALGDPIGSLSLSTSVGNAQSAGSRATGYSYAEGVLSFSGAAFTQLVLSTTANGFAIDNLSVSDTAVPEPATALLLGAGLLGMAGLRRRRRT